VQIQYVKTNHIKIRNHISMQNDIATRNGLSKSLLLRLSINQSIIQPGHFNLNVFYSIIRLKQYGLDETNKILVHILYFSFQY